MNHSELQQRSVGSDWLTNVVSQCLRLPPEEIEKDVPLVRYGLDSLGAIQLSCAISEKLKQPTPDALLMHHPDINSLESFIADALTKPPGNRSLTGHPQSELSLMLADSILPADIQPNQKIKTTQPFSNVLLTGATGFLGAYLLRAILRETSANVFCLVRSSDDNPNARVQNNLKHYGLWNSDLEPRLHVIEGDLLQPGLGISNDEYEVLAQGIDEIYHCGAAVNWVLPYSGLRDCNVLGTQRLLRLACKGNPKKFHFVSTLATCYSSNRCSDVTEQDDMLPYLDSIHLGYAQSKCVAESLVRRASERGLPATIHRPTLISGDGTTGFSNKDDLFSKMIRGCIEMGLAPNLNWTLDSCPVDYAADAIVGLSQQPIDSLRVFHLANPIERHWREVVLWINLFGYPLKLVSYREWLIALRTAACKPDHPLYRLRSFFLTRPSSESDLTLPEYYEVHRRNRVCRSESQEVISRLPCRCPPLDAKLLERYFVSFIEQNVLPNVPTRKKNEGQASIRLDAKFFESQLRSYFKDDLLRVESIELLQDYSPESITTELSSWQYGNRSGLGKYRVDLGENNSDLGNSLELFAKIKPLDEDVLHVSEKVALMCDERVGQAFARHKHKLGILGSHLREVMVYRQMDARFRNHVPEVYAAIENDPQTESVLLLESLANLTLLDSANDISQWTRSHVESAIQGLAQLHSVWYRRDQELSELNWPGPKQTASSMSAMTDLWKNLARYSWQLFSQWVRPEIQWVIEEMIAEVGTWWQSIEQMPHTLVHNDFNPRNIAFRNQNDELRLCAYDWELAAPGVPQRDLAELLCFVTLADCPDELVNNYIEIHRTELANATGQCINIDSWRLGFQFALRELIINRLPMYCLIHTFRPQAFLPRVVRAWQRLYDCVAIPSTVG